MASIATMRMSSGWTPWVEVTAARIAAMAASSPAASASGSRSAMMTRPSEPEPESAPDAAASAALTAKAATTPGSRWLVSWFAAATAVASMSCG